MDITAILTDYIEQKKNKGYSQETCYCYQQQIIKFLAYLQDKNIFPENVKGKDVDLYITKLNVSPQSKNQILSALQSFYQYVIFYEYADMKNPVSNVERIKNKRKNAIYLTPEQTGELVEKMQRNAIYGKWLDKRNNAILQLFLSTGIRRNELRNINQSDIQSDGRLAIRGKGKKERNVFIPDSVLVEIRDYLAHRKPPKPENRNALFTSQKGTRISNRHIDHVIGQISPVSPHKFRHSVGREHLKLHGDLDKTRQLLGHETMDMTLHYASTINPTGKSETEQLSNSMLQGVTLTHNTSGRITEVKPMVVEVKQEHEPESRISETLFDMGETK